MKIDIPPDWRDEVKVLAGDYNAGVDAKDITEVNMAVNGMVTLVFSKDKEIREQAIMGLRQVSQLQPGFLKNSIKILFKRYQDPDPERSEIASIALEKVFFGTKGEALITDPQIKQQLIEDANARKRKASQLAAKDEAYLIKKKKVEVDLTGLTPSIFRIGDYYNKCVVNDDIDGARNTLKRLVDDIYKNYPNDFIPSCLLLGRIAERRVRQSFFEELFKEILTKYVSKKEQEKEISTNILESIVDQVEDMLAPEVVQTIKTQARIKAEARKKELEEREKRRKFLEKVTVEATYKWDVNIRSTAEKYNEALETGNEKLLKSVVGELEKEVLSKDQKIRLDAASLLKQILLKNTKLVVPLVQNLVKSSNKPEVSEVLGTILEELNQLKLIDQKNYKRLFEENLIREKEREKIREEQKKKFEEIERVSIKFSADWEPKIVKLCEKFNESHLKKKDKDAQKLMGDFEKYLYAADREIRLQGAEVFKRIADKYPGYVKDALKKLVTLFDSEHEHREIASEVLGVIIESKNAPKIFAEVSKELQDKILEEKEERKKKLADEEFKKKIDAIKLDVTTIKINLEHKKFIQEICRRYNEAIKKQDKKKVMEEVSKIVDIVLNEKKEEILNQGIEVLGKIALQNIELIAPTIEQLKKDLLSKDEQKKLKAVKGLGEVAVARPGWAWEAIQKLVEMSQNDPDENARRKALLEISRVGNKNAPMLVEYVGDFINSLKDPDKHVRRMSAQVFCSIAEVIPLEAREAIPALSEALHDEYPLVRRFADKALGLIRQAMRSQA
ncbi:MAG: HEAT repeat domain-containing protein [Promethearchaeota archaeon]